MYILGLQLLPQTDKWIPVLPLFEIELEKKKQKKQHTIKKAHVYSGG